MTTDSRAPAGLENYLRQFMEERRAPGMQVAVVRDGEIAFLAAYGVANIEHRVPVINESVFSINSMTKAFTGVAVMQLVERGLLDLGAPVSRYLDGLPEAWRPITIRQLAALISGLPEISSVRRDGGVGLIGATGNDPQEALEAAFALPMEFAPGEGYRYVQTNFVLLGMVIDKLSGKPFVRFIEEEQLAAAGMRHTRFADDSDIVENRATTYLGLNPADPAQAAALQNSFINWPPILRTAAGLHSTAQDLARWLIALQDGKLLREASSLETLLTPVPRRDGKPGLWGISWPVIQGAKGRVGAPSGAVKAQIALYPDRLSVVLLTNLIGAITEQHQIGSGTIDLGFIDKVAVYFRGGRN